MLIFAFPAAVFAAKVEMPEWEETGFGGGIQVGWRALANGFEIYGW
jgi:hypothetical protein